MRLDGRLAVFQLFDVQVGQAQECRDTLFLGRCTIGALLVDLDQLGQAARAAEQALQVLRGATVTRLNSQRLVPGCFRIAGGRAVLGVDLADVGEQARRQLTIGGHLGLVGELLDDLLPVARDHF